jgi:uncharacterized membrane protein
MRRLSATLLRSFLQGLILISPIAATGFLIVKVFDSVDSMVPYNLVPFVPRGIGFFMVVVLVTLIGYLGTRFFVGRWLFDSFAFVLEHTPGVKHLYSSLRDIISSFVGEKKKFNKPVWVCVSHAPDTWRIGFMTQKDMSHYGMGEKVAVYLPHAYAISGWVILTDAINVKPVKEMTAAQAMKFAVSGGITTVEDEN